MTTTTETAAFAGAASLTLALAWAWPGLATALLAAYALGLAACNGWTRYVLGVPWGGAIQTRSRVVLDLGLWYWRGRILSGFDRHNAHASSILWLLVTRPADLGWRNFVPCYVAFGVRLAVLGAATWGLTLAMAGHFIWSPLRRGEPLEPIWLLILAVLGVLGGVLASLDTVEYKWANGAPPVGPDRVSDEFTPVGKFAGQLDEDEARQAGDERAELHGH